MCGRKRSWKGKLSTHWRIGTSGKTSSTKSAALSAMRRAPQLGQKPLRLQLMATGPPRPSAHAYSLYSAHAKTRAQDDRSGENPQTPAGHRLAACAPIVVCALYKFVTLGNFEDLCQPLLDTMLQADVKGTLLLAQEGINGTIAGSREGIDAVLDHLRSDSRLARLDTKESYDETQSFYRTKVKLKQEIVTLGVAGIDPKRVVGTYVKPRQWNNLISDPDVVLVDTRNDYEVEIGTFKRRLGPKNQNFP